jgi:hypothetical protein
MEAWWFVRRGQPEEVATATEEDAIRGLTRLAFSWKRLQLTPNSSFQSVRGTVLATEAVPQRWQSALLGAAEPHIR